MALERYVSRRDHDGIELEVRTRPHRRQAFPAVVLSLGLMAAASIVGLSPAERVLAGLGWEVARGVLLWAWIGGGLCAVVVGTLGWILAHPRLLRIQLDGRAVRVERVRRPPLGVRLAGLSRVRTDPTGLWLEERDGDSHHVELPGWRRAEREALAELIRDGVERAHRTAGSATEVPPELVRLRRRERETG